MKKIAFLLFVLITFSQLLMGQNSLVADGFGGRLWYKSYNYTVGSYSAYTVCGEDKQLYGWGSNEYSQLGNSGIMAGTSEPIKVMGMDKVAYYSTGYVMGAIKTDSSGWIWGKNNIEPIRVLDDVIFVDAGINSCAFVKYDGTVWSVGNQTHGEFGNGIDTNSWSNNARQMVNVTDAIRTAQGWHSTCVLLKDGSVLSAGFGANLGIGIDSVYSLQAVEITTLKDIVDIKASTSANLALDKSGELWVWGDAQFFGSALFGLGTMNQNNIIVPTKITGLKNIVAISGCADGYHFLALDEDKNCYGWGMNQSGCLGGTQSYYATPILLASDVVDIMAGETFSYILKSDGNLYAIGGGGANVISGSIWMDLSNVNRTEFTLINPQSPDFGLCAPVLHGEISPMPYDSTQLASEVVISFPNAFTPNNDGINNIFRALIKSGTIIDKYELAIYNRWGQQVFKTNDVFAGWDGKINGVDQPIGTFFYYARFNTPNSSTLSLKGDVTLLR